MQIAEAYPVIIYVVTVKKAGNPIFSHDVIIEKDRSFAVEINAALDTFRRNFPDVSLLDDDVEFSVAKKH